MVLYSITGNLCGSEIYAQNTLFKFMQVNFMHLDGKMYASNHFISECDISTRIFHYRTNNRCTCPHAHMYLHTHKYNLPWP